MLYVCISIIVICYTRKKEQLHIIPYQMLVVYSKISVSKIKNFQFVSTYVCASVKSVGKKIFNFRHTDFTIYY